MKNKKKVYKKLFFVQAILIISIFIISACSLGNSNTLKNMVTIDNQNIKALVKFSGTKLEDHSKVQNILSDLPGNKTIKKVSISDETVDIVYALSSSSGIKDSDFNSYWFDKDNYKKIFANNATALFALVNDLNYINFTLDSPDNEYTFSITRGELEPLYGMDIKNLSKDAARWKSFAIDQKIKSDAEIAKLFSVFPVKQNK